MVSWSDILHCRTILLCTVHCTLKLSKPRAEQREIRYRKLRSVDMSALSKDLRDSIFLQENITDLPTLVGKYETELARVFDIHAPEKKRTITVRPATAWWHGPRKEKKTEIIKAQITPGYWQRIIKGTMQSRQFSYQESKGKLLLQHHTRKWRQSKGLVWQIYPAPPP